MTKPTPNSTAEKIRKKNVSDIRLFVSYITPIRRVKAYRVIQRSSAVSSKCMDVLVLVKRVLNKIRNSPIKRFISPKIISNRSDY